MAIQLMDGFDNYKNLADVGNTYTVDNSTGDVQYLSSGGRFGGGAIGVEGASDSVSFPVDLPAGDTLILHASIFLIGSSDNEQLFKFLGGSSSLLTIFGAGNVGIFDVFDKNFDNQGTFSAPTDEWIWLELKILFSASGFIEIRINGNAVSTITGNFEVSFNPNVTAIQFSSTVTSDTTFIDDLVVLDTSGTELNDFLGDSRIQTQFPNGDGVNTDWTTTGTSHYTEVNETSHDGDSTYVESGTVGDRDTYTFPNLGVTPATIFAVQVSGIVRKTNANATSLKAVAVSNSTSGTSATDTDVSTTYSKPLGAIFTKDPNTGSDWTVSGLDNAEFGVEVG